MPVGIINTNIVLRNDTSANWQNNSQTRLLQGEIGIEFDKKNQAKIKIGDGETPWATLPYFNEVDISNIVTSATQVFQADLLEGETDFDAINRVVEDRELHKGDIAIVRECQFEKEYYTAYVRGNGVWIAMSGNYKAENIYFDENLITTTEIGNIVLSNGMATIPTAGKNLKEIWNEIFIQESFPETIQPFIYFNSENTLSGEFEVGTYVVPKYEVKLNPGSYTYGPETGINPEGWKVTLKNNNESLYGPISEDSGEFISYPIQDNDVLTYEATVSYRDGSIPVTNLGKGFSNGQIKGNELIFTCPKNITSFRNTFYGTLNDKNELNNNVIRNLQNKSNKNFSNGTKFELNIPINTQRVVIAYPSSLRDLTSIQDNKDAMTDIVSAFTQTKLKIDGNNRQSAIEYKVYYLDFAKPNDVQNKYTITI